MAGWKGMSRRFRDMLKSGRTFVQPGVFNAQSAQIAEKAGFETIGVSGYSLSATLIGKPDVGLTTLTEVAQLTGYICDAVNIPVLADADTGYGNAINAMRTVEQLIKCGAAAMFIEDQVAPKRCGHVSGKQIITMDEAVGKYRAAVRTRDSLDKDVVLVARCDARGVAGGSIDDTIRRGKAYMDAGVDVFFPEGVTSREELERVAKEVGAPLLFNRTGVSPNLTLADLNGLGVFLVANPGGAMRAAARGMWDYLHEFARQDQALDERIKREQADHPVTDMHAFVGFPDIWKLEQEFLPKDDLRRKYEGSIGFRP
jgi:2-methylisocitrate lyase-like PEP mutase family enzyme